MAKQLFTEAKAQANERWREKNKERKKYISYRSGARNFAKIAELADAKEILELIQKRITDLENK